MTADRTPPIRYIRPEPGYDWDTIEAAAGAVLDRGATYRPHRLTLGMRAGAMLAVLETLDPEERAAELERLRYAMAVKRPDSYRINPETGRVDYIGPTMDGSDAIG